MGETGQRSGTPRAVRVYLALVSLAACTGGPGEDPPPARSLELRIPIDREVGTFDPADPGSLDIVTHNVLRQLHEGLVDYEPATLAVVPRVARRWTASADGLSWAFELHPGVTFVDDPCFAAGRGREVTADDAKYSLERGLARYRGGPVPGGLPPIVGAPEFLAGEAHEVSGIVAAGPHELTIRLSRPGPQLLHYLARPGCYLVPPEADEAYGAARREHAVGTGPFRLVASNPVTGILMVRRPGYWQRDAEGRRLPYLDALRFIVTWEGHRVYALGHGHVFYSYLDAEPKPDASSGSSVGGRRYFVPWLNTIYLAFNFRSRHPIVRNRDLRAAVSLAVPRAERVIHTPATGLLPPDLPGYDPDLRGQHTDVERARMLLGGAPGLPPLTVVFPVNDGTTGRLITERLQQLGVDVRLRIVEAQELRGLVETGEADLFRAGWIADYPDPQNFLQLFAGSSPDNHGRYANADYDRLLARLDTELDAGRRLELARRLERMLLDDVAATFLRHERQIQIVAPRVRDWQLNCTNPLNLHFYERVRLDADAGRG